MARRRRLIALCAALALASALALGYQLWSGYRAQIFNAAVVRGDWQEAARFGGALGRFAEAHGLQSQKQWQAALKLYAALADEPGVGEAARYNIATLYLQQALEPANRANLELALPLVELAKQGYRELLRSNDRHWDAKYNLERALQIVPDPEEKAVEDWQTPQRSERAIITIETEPKGLP
ncbi:MAG: MxaK protein [Gammaproteobacteria bacterium]